MASLAGPRAKLDRAQEHLDELDRAIDTFFETHPYRVVKQLDVDAGQCRFWVKVNEAPPPRLGVILGDFVHNLRSALDHLVWQLVLLNGETPTENTAFPIVYGDTEFGNQAFRLKGVADKHRAVIQRVQPHDAGDRPEHRRPLALLREFSNLDKHRFIHAALGWYRSPSPKVEPTDAQLRWVQGFTSVSLKDGALLADVSFVPTGPHPDVKMAADFTLDIAFGEGPIRTEANDLVVLLEAVVETVGQFASDFP